MTARFVLTALGEPRQTFPTLDAALCWLRYESAGVCWRMTVIEPAPARWRECAPVEG